MGDTKQLRKHYATPTHPWEDNRIDEEKQLMDRYGLKTKEELWRMTSLLKGFKDQVKKLNATTGEQADREEKQLMQRLRRYAIVDESTTMDEVLGLDVQAILERRLQTRVYREGLARTIKQARQFITHQHVTVDGQTVDVPSYLVENGANIAFAEDSPLNDEVHPERVEQEHASDHVEDDVEEVDEIKATEERTSDETEESSEESTEQKELPARSTIENKTKDEIKEWAKEEYDVELSTNDLKDEMIDQLITEVEDGE